MDLVHVNLMSHLTRHNDVSAFTRAICRKFAYLFTLWADQSGLVLSLEEINNDRVIASLVNIPAVTRNFLVRPAIGIRNLGVGLLDDAVQVLVQTIQQKRQQLL